MSGKVERERPRRRRRAAAARARAGVSARPGTSAGSPTRDHRATIGQGQPQVAVLENRRRLLGSRNRRRGGHRRRGDGRRAQGPADVAAAVTADRAAEAREPGPASAWERPAPRARRTASDRPAAINRRFSKILLSLGFFRPSRNRVQAARPERVAARQAVESRASCPAASRAARSPREHRPNTSARTGRPGAATARLRPCRTRGWPEHHARRKGPAAGRSAADAFAHRPRARPRATDRRYSSSISAERRRGRRGSHVHDQARRRPVEEVAVPPEDLANPPPQPVAHDGIADALGNRDPDPWVVRAGPQEDLKKASGHPDAGGVALFEFPSLSKAVVAGEGLPGGRARVHTASLLRPLRRRAERTARPDRVRIRTRKPWVRLRRRLFG